MRIATMSVSATALNQIENLTQNLSNVQTQVSTGQRISKPEDDPAAVGQVIDLQAEEQQLAQYQQNASQALQTSQASSCGPHRYQESGRSRLRNRHVRLQHRERSAASAYATETNQLLEQAVQSANTALSGSYLFGGTASGPRHFRSPATLSGNITNVTYVGSATTASVPISNSTSISPSTDAGTNQGLADFMNSLVSLRDALTETIRQPSPPPRPTLMAPRTPSSMRSAKRAPSRAASRSTRPR